LAGHLLPTWGDVTLDDITAAAVRQWHAILGERTGPTRRAHAYALLKTILATAVADDIIATNPCRIRGARAVSRARPIRPASLAELAVIAETMPDRYRAAVLIAAWCGLRFGEVAELRRKDVDLEGGRLRIRRAVTHLSAHTHLGGDALLFPAPDGEHLRSDGALHRAFHAARAEAGRSDLTFHDLRHTGATLAAAAGATLAELMARLGHSTPVMAMRYQHATAERDRAIAQALSEFHDADIVQLRPRTATSSNSASDVD
jgi:integrase